KDDIVAQGQKLQANLQKYQKNKAVMSQSDLSDLQNKITKEEVDLRNAQAQFQRDLFEAQNQQMSSFMDKVRGVVKTIASQQELSMVWPNSSVLYSDKNLDITQQVIDKLK